MKNFIKSIRITIAFCILFSVCYVLILWVFGQFFVQEKETRKQLL